MPQITETAAIDIVLSGLDWIFRRTAATHDGPARDGFETLSAEFSRAMAKSRPALRSGELSREARDACESVALAFDALSVHPGAGADSTVLMQSVQTAMRLVGDTPVREALRRTVTMRA